MASPLPGPNNKDTLRRHPYASEHQQPSTRRSLPHNDPYVPHKTWMIRNVTHKWVRCCLPWSLLCLALLLTLLAATHTPNYRRLGLNDESLLPTVRHNIHLAILLYVICTSISLCTLLPAHHGHAYDNIKAPSRTLCSLKNLKEDVAELGGHGVTNCALWPSKET